MTPTSNAVCQAEPNVMHELVAEFALTPVWVVFPPMLLEHAASVSRNDFLCESAFNDLSKALVWL